MRGRAQALAEAVMRGELEGVMADVAEPLRPAFRDLAPLLPEPVTSVAVANVDVRGDRATVHLVFRGGDEPLIVLSQWEERDGRPVIVAAAPLP